MNIYLLGVEEDRVDVGLVELAVPSEVDSGLNEGEDIQILYKAQWKSNEQDNLGSDVSFIL